MLAQLERTKTGAVTPPGKSSPPAAVGKRSRHVSAEVRRVVWSRDQGRCTFVGAAGRCEETGGLEYHHVVPFAANGPTIVDNVQLRCRAHNAYEGALAFGDWRRRIQVKDGKRAAAPSRQS
jgi:hypothetical protein